MATDTPVPRPRFWAAWTVVSVTRFSNLDKWLGGRISSLFFDDVKDQRQKGFNK
jgi:hypothetical protein